MDLKAYTLGILVIIAPAFLHAGEVSENTQTSPFKVLLENFKAVETNIAENGTVRLTGHLAEKLDNQLTFAIEQGRAESAQEEKIAAAASLPSRGPAILSADGIVSGEISPVDYPSFGLPSESTKIGDELPLKSAGAVVGGTGNLGSVASAMRIFDDESAGRLPIPYNVAPTTPGKNQKENAKADKAGSPYDDSNSGTTFGRNPSDDSSIMNLIKSRKGENAAKDAAAKEQAELEALKDKEKEKEEQEKKAAQQKEAISKFKKLTPEYDRKQYEELRDFFDANKSDIQSLVDGDPDFIKKAAEIADSVPSGGSKTLEQLDSDRNKKRALVESVADFKEEGGSRFPPKPVDEQNRIRSERAH